MNNIKELTNELTKTLNTIKETEEKIKTVEDTYLKWFNENKTYLFTQEFTQEKKETLKEERDKRNKKATELRKNIEELSIKVKALENNIQYTFVANNISCIEGVLNKYVNKRIGEKTKDKIQKELITTLLEKNKDIDNDNISLYIMIQPYNNKIDITIYINSIQFEVIYNIWSGEKWFNDNKEGKIKLTNKYNYIDNIDLYAANLLSKQKEIKAEKEKIRKKIEAFNDSLKGDKLYSQYNISYSL